MTKFGFLDRFTIFCIFGMFTNGCECTPSLTENHKTLPILCFLDKKMDFMEDLSNLCDFQWILHIRRLTIFHTSQFGKNTGQNLTKLYMDINANFVKYLWNFGVNLCIMELRKIHQSFELQDGQPQCSSRLSKIFEFWTNFDLEYISGYGELSFHTKVLHRTTSWEASSKFWIK